MQLRGSGRSAGVSLPPPVPVPATDPSVPAPVADQAPAPVQAATADRPEKEAPPWTWGFFRWRPGEGRVLFWMILIHVAAVAGVVLFPVPGAPVLITAWALMFLGGLGTTVGYHRSLAHLSVRLRRPAEAFLVFFAIFNGSGAPASWAANHRKHHANADGEDDVSSPGLGGFWWSHLRWLWQAEQAPLARWAPDLDTPFHRFWTRWQWAILAASLLAGLPFGWAGLLWIGPVRLVVSLHGQCFVNSIAHMREGAKPGEDSSQNIAWLSVVHSFQGENWHGNHHAKPWSARIGWKWWQVDLGWATIRLLEATGLAWKVNRPR